MAIRMQHCIISIDYDVGNVDSYRSWKLTTAGKVKSFETGNCEYDMDAVYEFAKNNSLKIFECSSIDDFKKDMLLWLASANQN